MASDKGKIFAEAIPFSEKGHDRILLLMARLGINEIEFFEAAVCLIADIVKRLDAGETIVFGNVQNEKIISVDFNAFITLCKKNC